MNKYSEYKEAYKVLIKQAMVEKGVNEAIKANMPQLKLQLLAKMLPSILAGTAIGGGTVVGKNALQGDNLTEGLDMGMLAGMLGGAGVGMYKARPPKAMKPINSMADLGLDYRNIIMESFNKAKNG